MLDRRRYTPRCEWCQHHHQAKDTVAKTIPHDGFQRRGGPDPRDQWCSWDGVEDGRDRYDAPMPPIRVVLAEDGDLVRAGVLALLEGRDDIDVVATATSLPELLAAVDEHQPDVVLTDIRMPPDLTDEGIRAAIELRRTHPDTGVVALTQYSDVEYALDLVREGSDGRG